MSQYIRNRVEFELREIFRDSVINIDSLSQIWEFMLNFELLHENINDDVIQEFRKLLINYAYIYEFRIQIPNCCQIDKLMIPWKFDETRFQFPVLKGVTLGGDMFIAGGAVEKRLRSDYEKQRDAGNFALSDIDIFITIRSGANSQHASAQNVIENIKNNVDKGFIFTKGSVYTIVTRENIIQIIQSPYNSMIKLLLKFDFSYIQCAYDGKQVLLTYLAAYTQNTKESFITGMKNVQEYRLVKSYQNGYKVRGYDFDSKTVKRLAKKHKKDIYKDLRWPKINGKYCEDDNLIIKHIAKNARLDKTRVMRLKKFDNLNREWTSDYEF